MNWEMCKSYGLLEIKPQSNCVLLYYDRYNFCLVTSPNLYMVMESAIWQGDSLIIRGTEHGVNKKVYMFNGFNSFQQIL
jgi:hypothetical protein